MVQERVLECLLASIRQKEQELFEQEDHYYHNKRQLEERGLDLTDRRHRLTSILEEEQDKMKWLLVRYGASQDEAGHFYRKVQEYQDESEWVYRVMSRTLEEEIEESRYQFYQERDQIEQTLQDLRRKYYDIDH